MNTNNYKPSIAIPPGSTILENLEFKNMSQVDLAKRMDRPIKTINEIIKGTTAITPETAIQIERVLGISASYLCRLEANFQSTKAILAARKNLNEETDYLTLYPYKEMSKQGWVKNTTDKIERIEELLKYFGVNSLKLVPELFPSLNEIAFRKHKSKTISKEAIYAWLRHGTIESQGIEVDTYNSELFRTYLDSHIDELKSMTFEEDFNSLIPKLKKILAEFGIVLVYTPNMPNTYLCGATKWISPTKALIQLSNRGKYSDILWFTLFHEIGHILLHGKRDKFIDLEDEYKSESVQEVEADDFASERLISKNLFQAFLQTSTLDTEHIMKFAERTNVHPGIVVGKLHNRKILEPYMLNELRLKYNSNID